MVQVIQQWVIYHFVFSNVCLFCCSEMSGFDVKDSNVYMYVCIKDWIVHSKFLDFEMILVAYHLSMFLRCSNN